MTKLAQKKRASKAKATGGLSVGRPTDLTLDTLHKIEEAAALDASIEEIAFFAGIHRGTLYRWMQENPELKDRIEELRAQPILKARQTIIKSLDDPQHAQWYLARKRKTEFAEKHEVEGKFLHFGMVKQVYDQAAEEANRLKDGG